MVLADNTGKGSKASEVTHVVSQSKFSVKAWRWVHLSLGELGNARCGCERMWMQDPWHLGSAVPITHSDLLPKIRANTFFRGSQAPALVLRGRSCCRQKRGGRWEVGRAQDAPWLLWKRTSQILTSYYTGYTACRALPAKGCQESSPARFMTLNKCQERCWLVPSSQQCLRLLAQRCFVLFGWNKAHARNVKHCGGGSTAQPPAMQQRSFCAYFRCTNHLWATGTRSESDCMMSASM